MGYLPSGRMRVPPSGRMGYPLLGRMGGTLHQKGWRSPPIWDWDLARVPPPHVVETGNLGKCSSKLYYFTFVDQISNGSTQIDILIKCSRNGSLSKMEIKLKSSSTCWPQKEKLKWWNCITMASCHDTSAVTWHFWSCKLFCHSCIVLDITHFLCCKSYVADFIFSLVNHSRQK